MDTNTAYVSPEPPASQGYIPAPEGSAVVPGGPPPTRKHRGCIIAAVIAVLLLCGCIGTVAVVAAVMSGDQEAASYSEADFATAVGKIGVTWPTLPEGEDPDDYERVYSGEKQVDVVLTQSEISALMSFNHGASYWPIKSMDIQLTGGNSATASMVVSYAGRDWPVEVSGSGAAAGSGLDLSLSSASVMGISVPAEYLPMGADILENIINPRLARAGITIEALEGTDNGVHFAGTTWETAEYVPKQ